MNTESIISAFVLLILAFLVLSRAFEASTIINSLGHNTTSLVAQLQGTSGGKLIQ